MRRSEKEKTELIKEWKASGKSRTAWCKGNGIAIITLNRWIEKAGTGKTDSKANETVFAEAKADLRNNRKWDSLDTGLPEPAAGKAVIRVTVAGKILEIYCVAEKSALRNVLDAVAECL